MIRFARLAGRLLALATLAPALSAQTNVLLVVMDDVGVDGIAAYREGNSPAPTPTLDALAARGVLFRNAYALPTCTATRATLHTGRHAFRTGLGAPPGTLPLSETTLPEILPSTYASALIGKWHLGNGATLPNQTGWQHFAGSQSNVSDYYNWTKNTNGQTANETNYATSECVDDALAWIQAQTKPWVMSLNFQAPHAPFHAPPSGLHTYNLTGQNPRRNPAIFYKAMLQALDTELGRLLTQLGSATVARTDILVIGDNGTPSRILDPPFPGPGKGTVYEAGVNVPLIIAGPSVVNPGREVTALVHSVDMFHTMAEMAGIDARTAVPANVELDGISVMPYLRNVNQEPLRELLYVEQFGRNVDDLRAVRDTRYKLIELDNGSEELFDLQTDAHEQTNLLPGPLSSAQQFAYDRLKAELDRLEGRASWFAFGTGCSGAAGTPELTAATGQAPRLGQTLSLTVNRLGSSPSILGLLGFSIDEFAGLPLPLDLTFLGAPSCTLWTAAEFAQPLTNNGGSATWGIPIPSSASLLGSRFYQQAFVLDSSANPFGAVFSNAGYGVIEAN